MINTGEWTYIAAKNDGTNMKVYINGEEKGSALSSGIITSASTAVLCGDAPIYSADFKFNGQMDEIRICDVARTDAWIVATYKTTHLPSSFYSCADQIEISENLSNLLLPALILPVFIGFVVRRKRK